MNVNRSVFAALALVVCLFSVLETRAQSEAKKAIREGNRAYEKEQFERAEEAYRSAKKTDSNPAIKPFNLGDALYRQQRYDEAEAAFAEALKESKKEEDRAKALHNLGNAQYQQKKYKEAAQSFAESLKLKPGDVDAQYNLAQSLRKLKSPPQQKSEQNKSSSDQNSEQSKPEDSQKPGNQEARQPENNGEQSGAEKGEPEPGKDQAEGDRQQQMRPEELEQLLESLEREDARVQKKLRESDKKNAQPTNGKNW